ncbi:hypothetical protein B0H11DRAFT_1983062 [Mycena galericulata]|nr:hypothetical protein B0H11DRAFT_1983062 [Mycena galericulata]
MDPGQARRREAAARARRRRMGVVPQQRGECAQGKGCANGNRRMPRRYPCRADARAARVCVCCIDNHDNTALNAAARTASALSHVIAHEETVVVVRSARRVHRVHPGGAHDLRAAPAARGHEYGRNWRWASNVYSVANAGKYLPYALKSVSVP